LLQSALQLFDRNGYEATAIESIASRAQVAIGGFYRHFRSKRQILLVLMNELLQKLEQIDMQPAASDIRSAIVSVLRAGLTTDLAYAGAYRAWKEAMMSDRELAALDDAIRDWTRARLLGVFGLLRQFPGARRDLDIELFASVMDTLFWSLLGTGLQSDRGVTKILGHIIYCSLFHD
jgi:AcrR family transcriptional regulator